MARETRCWRRSSSTYFLQELRTFARVQSCKRSNNRSFARIRRLRDGDTQALQTRAVRARSDRPASMIDVVATVSRIAHAGFTARAAVLRAWMRVALSDGPSTKRNIRETREVIGSIQNGQGHDQSFEEGNERCDSALPSNQRRTLPNRRLTMYSKKPNGSFMHHPATTGDTHTDIGSAVRLRLRDRRWRSSLQMLSP